MKKKAPAAVVLALAVVVSLFLLFKGSGAGRNNGVQESSKDAPASRQTSLASQGPHQDGRTQQEARDPSQTQPCDESGILIPDAKRQLIGVRTVEASVRPVRTKITTVGRVGYNERGITTVNLKFEGWVERIYADYVGKFIGKGERLADIYSPELYSTQLEYINLLKWKKSRASQFQRFIEFSWEDRYGATGRMTTNDLDALVQVAKQRFALWELTDEYVSAIEAKEEPVRIYALLSPASGHIVQKNAVQGTRFGVGEKLFDIADLSTVWVIADVYEYEAAFVKAGQTAKITLSYLPSREFTSRIDYVYPSLAANTRTVRVRLVLPNPGNQLKPGMFGNVEVTIDLGRGLVVPEDSIIDTGSRQVVYVDKGGGVFEQREVLTGTRADGVVEIKKGLLSGERVASAAAFMIDSEAKLKGIVKCH